jgi:hypothetical protein
MRNLSAGIFRFSAVVTLLSLGMGACGSGMAQKADAKPQVQVVDGIKTWVPYPKPPQSPFPLDGRGRNIQSLEFLTPGQMSAGDARFAENAQTAIAERAAHQGFDLWDHVGTAPGEWGYEQAVCPAFPDQMILEYSRDRGNGDISLFSAIIPRGNEGHVRVIPVRRRSYSLWTSTPTNALTLNDFNHLVKESPNGLDPDWLTIGLCYAALAGGHVRAALHPLSAAEEVYPLFVPAKLTSFSTTGAEVRFADISRYTDPKAHAMEWVMNFAQSGRLLNVKHVVAGEIVVRTLPPTQAEPSRPVEGSVDLSKPAH